MGSEAIAGIAAVAAALVTAGPAYLSARRSGKAAADTAAHEGAATREAVAALSARLDADGDARDRERVETREDLRALRRDVQAVREWQAGHDAEHVAMRGK